ncbi:uroporphyrinogen-III synthase [Bosea sp. (in: a-proteobacteria)]|uniref:uroporphyrinogen-III synthase n=1 Tax=Bosea sp. (in: a-proteobacteria) TaxID=1871050 RepID=UPI002607B40F|nr:uroporphyrinogen-III synthase [Bosea sp. (in: a-proteobacteria)]MCO5090791.1 uroporphyrinogen-III synthase [Bosea sp. (in: a-proteobacteria)]
MRVFVFRPRPDAERTARAIAGHGFEPVVAPLFEVIRLPGEAPAGSFDAIVVTSGNAVPALAQGPAAWRDLPVFTVGSRTAAKVREAGLDDTRSADGDRNDLIALIRRTLPAPARLLMIVARDRKEDVAERLREAGYEVALWIAYAAEAIAALPEETQAALRQGEGAALHYSPRGAQTFIALTQAAGIAEKALELTHVALSANVAAPLIAAGASTVLVAEHPEEAALLAALEQVSARQHPADPAGPGREPEVEDAPREAPPADAVKPSPEAVAPTEALPREFRPPPVEPKPPQVEREPARTPWIAVAAAGLVAGALGGALVGYVLPKAAPPPAAPSGDAAAIAALQTRLESVQAALTAADRRAASASDAAAKTGSELQAVTARLAALGNAPAPDTSAFSAQVQRAEAAAAATGQRLDQFAGRLGAVETRVKAASGASPEAMAAARIVLAERVRQALAGGRPFSSDVAALTRSGVAPADLAALAAVAGTGAPTREALLAGFRKHGATFQREVMPASASWTDKLIALASRVVTVRPVGESASTDPATLPIRLEGAIAAGDAAKAAALWGELPEPARRASAEFGADLGKRAAADAAIAKIAQDAVAALGTAG